MLQTKMPVGPLSVLASHKHPILVKRILHCPCHAGYGHTLHAFYIPSTIRQEDKTKVCEYNAFLQNPNVTWQHGSPKQVLLRIWATALT